jgi:AraC family transcriptional regulator
MTSQVTAIYTAIEFIENHLKEEITIEDIAAAAGYSLYHFIRTFNQIVHHSPYDYLIRRRLSESAKELIENDRRILDIALDYRFKNHETYSRAFKRMFRMQPNQWRSGGQIPNRSLLPPSSLAYLTHINQAGICRPELLERNKTDLIGLMSQGDEIYGSYWQCLKSALADHKYPQPTGVFYGIHMVVDHKVSFCFVGVEVIPGGEVFPPLCTLQLPAGTYVQFLHQGMKKNLSLSLDYIYHTWLARSNYRIQHPFEIQYLWNEMPLADREIKNWQIQLPINI